MQDLRFSQRSAIKNSIFCDIMQRSPLKVNRRFGGTCGCVVTSFIMVSCLASYLTLKMESTYSSEMSVDFQQTIWR
jgi:hypothetical protein